VRRRPQAAKPASLPRVSRSLSGEVVAHRPYGSSQTDRIRLPYAAAELSAGLSFLTFTEKKNLNN